MKEFLTGGPETGNTVVLAHGAGAAMDSEWMNTMAAGLAERGLRVVRFEFPYMRQRRTEGKRRGPDRAPVLLQSWRNTVEALASDGPLVIGGRSMGGRIASMIADEAGVAGLICMGYPFHPPRRPDKLRVAHLAELRTQTLILQGTRDPFGGPDEVATYELAAGIRVHWIEDGDHSFKPRVRSGRTLEGNLHEAMDAVAGFVAEVAGGGDGAEPGSQRPPG